MLKGRSSAFKVMCNITYDTYLDVGREWWGSDVNTLLKMSGRTTIPGAIIKSEFLKLLHYNENDSD